MTIAMRSVQRALAAALLAVLVVVGLGGCEARPAGTAPVRVGIDMSTADSGPTVVITIGRDQHVRVLLDSGSVGLRVLDSAVPSGSGGIETSGQPDRFGTEDGTEFRGFISRAVVHIGALSTTTPVDFESITQLSCRAELPHCPRLSNRGPKVVGILGIGMSGNGFGLPTNPLLSLPAPYDQSWSIHLDRRVPGGELTLGTAPPRSPDVDLPLVANSNPQFPSRAWDDAPSLCWGFDNQSQCGATTFDTGARPVYMAGYPSAPRGGLDLRRGRTINVFALGASRPVWTFTSGSPCCSPRAVVLQQDLAPTLNTGIAFFQTHVVTFDNRDGKIDIS